MIHRMTPWPTRQRGATLLLGLLLLAVLGLIAVAAASDGLVQQRIAGNEGITLSARHAAHSALQWAEDWLMGRDGRARPEPCTAGCDDSAVIRAAGAWPPAPENQPAAWWIEHAHPDGYDPVSGARLEDRSGAPGVPGLWLIEEVLYLDPADTADVSFPTSYYRIIARNHPSHPGQPVVLEGILARPWGEEAWSEPFPARGNGHSFCDEPVPGGHCGRRAWRRMR